MPDDLYNLTPSPAFARRAADAARDAEAAQAVADAIANSATKLTTMRIEIQGYGTRDLACVLRHYDTGVMYDVRVTRRENS